MTGQPIEAQLPDGTILEFPEGTADSVIQAKVREHLHVAPVAVSPNVSLEALKGLGQSAAGTVLGLGKLVRGGFGAGTLTPQEEAAFNPETWGAAPTTPFEHLGKFTGDFGQLMVGNEAAAPELLRGGGMLLRAAKGALAQGGMAAAQTGDVNQPLAAALGAAGGVAGGARPATASKKATPDLGTRVIDFIKRRSAARILDVMRPAKDEVPAARDIAYEVAAGTPYRATAGGIGVGSLDELAARAKARADLAGKTVGSFRDLTTPTKAGGVTDVLRSSAADLETVPPPHDVLSEVPTGILDEHGASIMGIKSESVPGTPTSGFPEKVAAFRKEADTIDNMATQYPDAKVPAGELFKFRNAIGQRVAEAYNLASGEQPSAAKAAGKLSRDTLSDVLHTEVPASVIPDREYHVFITAWANIQNHSNVAMTNQGLKGLKDLLAGRLAGIVVGGALGIGAGSDTRTRALGGVAGALGGVALGESAKWGSFRAATYSKLAEALNAGEINAAADIIRNATAAATVSERQRNRKAQSALQSQAAGVIP